VEESSALAELARYAAIPLPRKPLLVPWVQPVEIGDGLLELRADQTFYPLRHPLFSAAFRAVEGRLAGTCEVESITEDLPAGVDPAVVVVLLKMLRSLGLLLDGDGFDTCDGASRNRLLFHSHFTVQPQLVEKRVSSAVVRVVGPDLIAERVERHLRAAGFERPVRTDLSDLAKDGAAGLLVACTDAPTRSYLSRLNAAALAKGQPWLRVAAHGSLAWLGPLVLPGETACFECLQARERANACGQGEPPDFEFGAVGAFVPQVETVAAQAAAEAVRFLGGHQAPATIGHVYELSATSPRSEGHVILRDPDCAACAVTWAEAS
jgi:bacteriocin biosynthesis cyclodehydratase domain-containing protein